MTEATHTDLAPELRSWCETWKTCIEQVLSQVSGQPTAFEVSAEAVPGAETDLWFTVVAGGTLHGELTFRLSAESCTRLAQKFLGETEPSGGPTAEHKEALEELLRQVAGQAATALASTAGGEVKLTLAASAAPSWAAAATATLRTRDEAGSPVSIEIQISAALGASLQPRSEPQTPPPEIPPPAPPAIASYDRLKDVGLEVKLRFGSRRMLLRDVLALSAGVVVELESNVNSPVDLLLDGRIVAQGEVVVIDGKYGLRVTEVMDRGSSA
jgi:flagellar motor switch protein FliN/FliY